MENGVNLCRSTKYFTIIKITLHDSETTCIHDRHIFPAPKPEIA